MRKTALKLAAAMLGAVVAGPALAATCQNTGSYERWLEAFKKDAAAQGISPRVIAEAAPSMTFDPAIVRRDHGQAVFQQTFLQFSDRMVGGGRIPTGLAKIKQHAALFAKIEKQYGVPAPVLAAFWGLESDFGANFGNYKILSAIATLAYDCRRPDFFRTQLLDALRIIERGDQRVEDHDRRLGRRVRRHAVHRLRLSQERRRLRRRRPPRPDQQHPRHARLRRQLPGQPRLAARPALAAGGACAGQSAVGPGRPDHPASALAVGGLGREAGLRLAAVRRICRPR